METNSNEYHISFFRPTTEQARLNRNLVIKFVLIWAVAIFGFQILLKVVEKPTPEQTYITYQGVWANVQSENATETELKEFANSSLSVLGKIFLSPSDKESLNNALSWSVYQLSDSVGKELLIQKVANFEELRNNIETIQDKNYIAAKVELMNLVAPILGLEDTDARKKLLPLELVSSQMKSFTVINKEAIPVVMAKYLIHNQSFLTDFIFLGFPFHYFYTAVFLLILFVFLCWLYCYRTDKMNKRLNLED